MRLALSFLCLLSLALGCSSQPADCEALAAEQPECMNDDAIADCEDTNAACEGEVLVLESCPLQFACNDPVTN